LLQKSKDFTAKTPRAPRKIKSYYFTLSFCIRESTNENKKYFNLFLGALGGSNAFLSKYTD